MSPILLHVLLFIISSEAGKCDVVYFKYRSNNIVVTGIIDGIRHNIIIDPSSPISTVRENGIKLLLPSEWARSNGTKNREGKKILIEGPMCLLRFNTKVYSVVLTKIGKVQVPCEYSCSLGQDFLAIHKVSIDFRYNVIKIPFKKLYYESDK